MVNISLAAISPKEMHEVNSASTSKSIPEFEEETTPGQIRNNEKADVESNVSKACAAEDRNDDIKILPNDVSCTVAGWPESINHDISVEIVKAGSERYRNKGPFQSMFRVTKVGDREKKVVSCPSGK